MSCADLCWTCGQASISTGGIGCVCGKRKCPHCGALKPKGKDTLCTQCWCTDTKDSQELLAEIRKKEALEAYELRGKV